MSWSMKSVDFCSEPMNNKPVSALPGVGPATEGRLNAMGYYKASDVYKLLQRMNFDQANFCSWMTGNFRGCRATDCYKALMRWHRQFGHTDNRRHTSAESQTTQRPSVPSTSNSNNCNQRQGIFDLVHSDFIPRPIMTARRTIPDPTSSIERIFDNVMRRMPSTSGQPSQRPMTFEEYMLGPVEPEYPQNTSPRTSEGLDRNTTLARSAQAQRAPEQTVQNPRVSEPLAQISSTLQQLEQNLGTPEQSALESVQSTRESLQPVTTSAPVVQPSRSNEQTASPSRANEPTELSRSTEQTVQPQRTNEEVVQPSSDPAQSTQTQERLAQNSRTTLQSGENSRISQQLGTNTANNTAVGQDPLCSFFIAMEATVKKLQSSSSSTSTTTTSKEDSTKGFFEAMEATIRTFAPETVLEVKTEIFIIINEYERRCLQGEADPPASTSQPAFTQN